MYQIPDFFVQNDKPICYDYTAKSSLTDEDFHSVIDQKPKHSIQKIYIKN